MTLHTPLAGEHAATRHAAGLFDFSFMACFEVAGPDARRYLERVQVRRLDEIAAGQLAYTLVCRPDGSVLDDATVWHRAEGRYTLFTGRRSDREHLTECAQGFDVDVRGVSEAGAACAVQGPLALRILRAAIPGHDWETLRYFHFRTVDVDGMACDIARLGYSGEAGFEVVSEAAAAARVWELLAGAGAGMGLAECSFEAADILRIEAGFILFSRELAQRATPFELGLGRLVRAGNGFIGDAALARNRWRAPAKCLVGLRMDPDAGPVQVATAETSPEPGRAVLTSACDSPLYGRIGLGFVTAQDRAPGTRVSWGQGRGATVARIPFYDPMKQRPRRGWCVDSARRA